MTTSPIPAEALNNHIAILGKTGSGKSNAAKTVVERLLDAGERVCVLDPTGTWFGLRLTPKGKPSPYPVVIFGGNHADLQIGGAHGAAIAETVGTTTTPAIIDTRLLSVADRTRFFTDFAETLLRKNQGVLTLVIDEAHLFAPKGKINDPMSGKMLGAANNLVSLGRGIGLRIILISQRPAKVHNDSLGQVETLVAMRMLLPHDREAVKEWVKEQADVGQAAEILASLPKLATGEAWVWAPQLDLLDRRQFPLARTFDSGKAPAAGEAGPALAPLDLAVVTARLETVAADVLANDPRNLKAEIARLHGELRQKPTGFDAASLKEAEDRAYERGLAEGREAFQTAMRDAANAAGAALAKAAEDVKARLADIRLNASAFISAPSSEEAKINAPRRSASQTPPQIVARPPPPAAAPTAAPAITDESLTPAKQKILDALAWGEKLQRREGVPTTKTVLAFLVGMTAGGGGFNNYLGSLRSAGLITYPQPNAAALTDDGRARASAPQIITNEEVQEAALAKVDPKLQRLMRIVIAAYPGAISKEQLAGELAMTPSGGGFNNYCGKLRSLQLLDYPQPGFVRATDFLFPEAL